MSSCDKRDHRGGRGGTGACGLDLEKKQRFESSTGSFFSRRSEMVAQSLCRAREGCPHTRTWLCGHGKLREGKHPIGNQWFPRL